MPGVMPVDGQPISLSSQNTPDLALSETTSEFALLVFNFAAKTESNLHVKRPNLRFYLILWDKRRVLLNFCLGAYLSGPHQHLYPSFFNFCAVPPEEDLFESRTPSRKFSMPKKLAVSLSTPFPCHYAISLSTPFLDLTLRYRFR